jgi:class 3 adenylate cyclase/tetratricopeptide (TPR) repeat protein
MQCPHCRQEIPADARFCGGCGQQLARTCPSCGHTNALESRFCNACGHRLDVSTRSTASEELVSSPEKQSVGGAARSAPSYKVERRQLTVLFCDLVGSTALAKQLDPEELRTLMQAYQQICCAVVERYEGQVAQFLGDGVMVYFGWPRAHEDDAERAVRAGLEIVSVVKQVEAPSPLAVHIGIASGPVVVGEGAGEDATAPKLAVGETPNLAARLQGLAGADEIVIAPTTHALTSGMFDYEELGERQLKGIVEPVRPWRVTALSQAVGRFEATRAVQLTPLVGREEELSLLLHRWEQAKEGEGQVVLLCGEAGIGKSRITQVLQKRIAGEPHLRLRYQCSPYHTSSAFYPIIDHLHRAAQLSPDDAADVKLAKVEALMAPAQAEDPRVVPLIAALLDIQTSDKYPPLNDSPQKQKDETIRALGRQLIALSREAPLLVSLEDVHWIDPSSLEAFDHLVQLAQAHRVLAVMTLRPEFQPRWTGQGHVTLLTLNRLGTRQTAELAKRVAGVKPLPAEVLDQIAAKTDGVPLFVEELTKSVIESGLLKEERDHYSMVAPLPALAIPSTLRDSLMARLDRLAPVKELAQVGACIGREFGYRLLSLIAPMQAAKLDETLDALVRSGLVFQSGSPPEASYVFKHALVQDAAYESLLKAKRAHIHARVGEALKHHFPVIVAAQPEIVARHYTVAELHEEAIPYWQRAGELALRRMALQESIAHLERGIELVERMKSPASRDRLEIDLRAALGVAWVALQGWAYPEVERNLARAWELEEKLYHGDHSLRVLWGLEMYQMCVGRARESLVFAEQLLAQGDRNNDQDMRLVGHGDACISHSLLGNLERSVRHADSVLACYDAARDHHLFDLVNHDVKTVAEVYKACALGFLGYPDRAARLAEECIAHARALGHAFNLGWALHFLALHVFSFRGEVEKCGALLNEFERLAHEQQLVFYRDVVGPNCRAGWLLRSDRPEEADLKFRESLPLWSKAGMLIGLPGWKTWHAQTAGLLDRLDEGLTLVEEALEQIQRPGWEEGHTVCETLRIKGWLLQRCGDTEQAEACFQDAIDIARQQQAKSFELRAATSYAQLLKDRGRCAEAIHVLQPVYDWFSEGRSTQDHIEAKALLDELRT